MRFFLGLVVGLVALGGYVGYDSWRASSAPPCAGRCGEGTTCDLGSCRPERPAIKGKRSRKRRRRRARRRRSPGQPPVEASTTAPLKRAGAAELKPRSEGPGLGGADRIDLTADRGAASRPELSKAEVDRRFRRLEPRLLACIARAREGWEVAGKVQVGFRIERSGAIKRVRVGAPALLMRRGLYGCVAPLVRGLRFGSSGRSLIMTYPYAID